MNRYLVIQRCKHFGIWPNDWSFESQTHRFSYKAAGLYREVHLAIGVKTYPTSTATNRNDSPPLVGFGPPLLTHDDSVGFWVGNTCVHPAGETSAVGVRLRHPGPDELDLYVGVSCEKDLPFNELLVHFGAETLSIVGFINVILRDIIVPVQPSQVVNLQNNTQEENVAILAFSRQRYDETVIVDAFRKLPRLLSIADEAERRRLMAASRRYLKSYSEDDEIDKFCDLWEACEFLTYGIRDQHGLLVKGNSPVSRIAYALAVHMSIGKRRLENKLIRPMYAVRKNIVHDAIEDPGEVGRYLNLLRIITECIMRLRMELPYETSAVLEESIGVQTQK